MKEKKGIKRSFELDKSLVADFDAWIKKTRVIRNGAVELGIWIVTHLSAERRDGCLALMDAGYGPQSKSDGDDFLQIMLDDNASNAMRRRWLEIFREPDRSNEDTTSKRGSASSDSPIAGKAGRALKRVRRKSG